MTGIDQCRPRSQIVRVEQAAYGNLHIIVICHVERPVRVSEPRRLGKKMRCNRAIADGLHVELPNAEALPEKHRNAIALLKMVGEEQHIPEVGYKGKHQKYFVYA